MFGGTRTEPSLSAITDNSCFPRQKGGGLDEPHNAARTVGILHAPETYWFFERMTLLLLICDVFETCLITKIFQRRWTAAWRWVSPVNISFGLKLGGMFVFQSHQTRCIAVVQHSGWGFFVLGVFFFSERMRDCKLAMSPVLRFFLTELTTNARRSRTWSGRFGCCGW